MQGPRSTVMEPGASMRWGGSCAYADAMAANTVPATTSRMAATFIITTALMSAANIGRSNYGVS
ncbi:hypothetical protein D3C80_2003630 [compost metagenome]